MTVETPDVSDASPTTDAVRVKDAGEGTTKVKNPFEADFLPSYSQEEWESSLGRNKTAQDAQKAKAAGNAAKLIDRAKSFIGTPYKWGGTGPLGFDCSGFTQYLYKELGINLPRVSYQQAQFGARVPVSEAKPGDLIAWDNSSRNDGADHIAIALGNGYVIHAPKPGEAVKISRIWDAGHAWGVAMNL